ncbi:hypothetical protein BU16DRAFT_541769 [Lophium mytilinum]|uniref:Uncharacterized protein n=1 Tax=Lophium mytilinum TaxID=390894 RepID=A0A6A6QLZ1_9PEZI|nr:hypothetical protein BU16DRAFT_541769 [Lophium mytilinum]
MPQKRAHKTIFHQPIQRQISKPHISNIPQNATFKHTTLQTEAPLRMFDYHISSRSVPYAYNPLDGGPIVPIDHYNITHRPQYMGIPVLSKLPELTCEIFPCRHWKLSKSDGTTKQTREELYLKELLHHPLPRAPGIRDYVFSENGCENPACRGEPMARRKQRNWKKNHNGWRLLALYKGAEQTIMVKAEELVQRIQFRQELVRKIRDPKLRFFVFDEERSWDEKVWVYLWDELVAVQGSQTAMWKALKKGEMVVEGEGVAGAMRDGLRKAAEKVRVLEVLALNLREWEEDPVDTILPLRIEEIGSQLDYPSPLGDWVDEGLEKLLTPDPESFEVMDESGVEDSDDDDDIEIIIELPEEAKISAKKSAAFGRSILARKFGEKKLAARPGRITPAVPEFRLLFPLIWERKNGKAPVAVEKPVGVRKPARKDSGKTRNNRKKKKNALHKALSSDVAP